MIKNEKLTVVGEIPHVMPEEVLDRTTTYRELFGLTEIDAAGDPALFAQAVDQLNPRFQGERDLVRFGLEQNSGDFNDFTKGVIRATASALEMHKRETPIVGDFDAVVVLGGARRANYDRAEYAARALTPDEDGVVHASGSLVLAGSNRRLIQGEAETAEVEGAETEADLLEAAAERVTERFGVEAQTSIVAEERAGTPKVFERVVNDRLRSGQRAAGVTTQIYRVSTDLDFTRVGQEHGIDTAVAGSPSHPAVIARRTDMTYHSEILRTLRAAANSYQQ